MAYHRNYCTECDWSASTKTYSRHEVSKRAIDHFCETQHTIESETDAELAEIPLLGLATFSYARRLVSEQ